LLAPHFTLFHYDRRGRGDTLPYAVEREIEDLDTLINEAGGSAFMFGTASAAALADALPNAQWRTLEGQTYDVQPEALAPVLEAFFAG
jgi:hypothetical protein